MWIALNGNLPPFNQVLMDSILSSGLDNPTAEGDQLNLAELRQLMLLHSFL